MDAWFDGDYSECYYVWGHVSKDEFGDWITIQEKENGNDTLVCNSDIEYLWVEEVDEERFNIVPEGTPDAIPITRYVTL